MTEAAATPQAMTEATYLELRQAIAEQIDSFAPISHFPEAEAIIKIVRAHLSGALPCIAGGWRSIESAPKDGTHILVWLEEDVLGSRVQVMRTGKCAVIASMFAYDAPKPTHWQPLPLPPTPSGEEQKEDEANGQAETAVEPALGAAPDNEHICWPGRHGVHHPGDENHQPSNKLAPSPQGDAGEYERNVLSPSEIPSPTQGNAIEGLVERLKDRASDDPLSMIGELLAEAATALETMGREVERVRARFNAAVEMGAEADKALTAAQERITRLENELKELRPSGEFSG